MRMRRIDNDCQSKKLRFYGQVSTHAGVCLSKTNLNKVTEYESDIGTCHFQII